VIASRWGIPSVSVISRYSASTLSGPYRFLYVGRLSDEKGLDDLLAAFCLMRSRYPESKLDLVGAGYLKDALMRQAAELGITNDVIFQGSKSIDELAELYMSSDALVLPSRSEPWGLVANEALSYGCPLIVSDACGCAPALVQEDITGFTFPVGNVAALSEAMCNAAAVRPRRQDVAAQCIELISTFTPERAAEQILAGCRQILTRS